MPVESFWPLRVPCPRRVPQLFDAARKSRAASEQPMAWFLPALRPKANGCGLSHSLLRSTDVGVLDDLRPLGDFGFAIAIARIGRAGADRHSEIGGALVDLRRADQPGAFRVLCADDS